MKRKLDDAMALAKTAFAGTEFARSLSRRGVSIAFSAGREGATWEVKVFQRPAPGSGSTMSADEAQRPLLRLATIVVPDGIDECIMRDEFDVLL